MNSGEATNNTSGAFVVAVHRATELSETQMITTAGEANDLLATVTSGDTGHHDRTEERGFDDDIVWLILVPAAEPEAIRRPETLETIRDMSLRLNEVGDRTNKSNVAMIVEPAITAGPAAYELDISLLIDRSFSREQKAPQNRAIAVCCHTALAVGGFDPTVPGIGLADLATRIGRAGRTVIGAPEHPLALTELEPHLTIRDQLRSVADWYRRHGESGDVDRYRDRVMAAVRYEPPWNRSNQKTDRPALVKQIRNDAKQRWLGPRPDEAQQGVGQRADWRFLIRVRSVRHLLLTGSTVGQAPPDGQPHFLEADGFAEQVSFHSFPKDRVSAPEVVVVGLGADVLDGLAAAAPVATAVVELDRDPVGRFRRMRALRSAGFEPTAVYLVTPDLAGPKTYVSLGEAEAIQWLLAPPPPLPGTRTGLRRTVGRWLVRTASKVVSKMVSMLASMPLLSAFAGVGTHGLVVATRGSSLLTTAAGLAGEPPQILMTSGHDEGSRAVLVSLGEGGSPGTVTKMSPRPRYNSNAEAEAEVIKAVRSRIGSSGASAAADLVPVIEPAVAEGGLRGGRERYAGRWTATDLCNRVPATRTLVLQEVLDAIDRFSLATVSRTEPWSDELFDAYIGDLFARYRETIGWSPTLNAFCEAMAERSNQLLGEPIPLVLRHYDLGPWNVVFGDGQTAGGSEALTIIDWEVAPPRQIGQDGLGGADQLYFTKYWLHIAMETRSVEEELEAFEFVAGATQGIAARALTKSFDHLAIDHRFLPLLAAHVWLEAALYTANRRSEHGGDPGSPARYVETLARRRVELLQFWS